MNTNVSIDTLNLSGRVVTTLKDASLDTVAQVLELLGQGDNVVLTTPGIGPKTLEDLKTVLREAGYRSVEFTLSPGLSIAEVEAEVLSPALEHFGFPFGSAQGMAQCRRSEGTGSVEGAGLNGAVPAQAEDEGLDEANTEAGAPTEDEGEAAAEAVPQSTDEAHTLSPRQAQKRTEQTRMRQHEEAMAGIDAQIDRVEQASGNALGRIAEQRHKREQEIVVAHSAVDDLQRKVASAQAQAEQMKAHADSLQRPIDLDGAMGEADAVVHAISEILGDDNFGDDLLNAPAPTLSELTAEEMTAARQAVEFAEARLEHVQLELLEAEEYLQTLQATDAEQQAQEDENIARIRETVDHALAVLAVEKQKLDDAFADVVEVIPERKEKRTRRQAKQQAVADELIAALWDAWDEKAIEAVLSQARERKVLHLVSGPANQRRQELDEMLKQAVEYAASFSYRALPPGAEENVLAIALPGTVHIYYVGNDGKGHSKKALRALAGKNGGQFVSVIAPGAKDRGKIKEGWKHWESWSCRSGEWVGVFNPLARHNGRSRNGRHTGNQMEVALKGAITG